MKSMTGFGFASGSGKDYRVEVNIKSVNSRFTDVKFYTSSFYFSLEKELKSFVLNNCSRGQWIVRIDRFPVKPPSQFVISRDKKQARRWQELYKNLSREMGVKNDLNVSHLAQLEGVVNTIEKAPPLDSVERTKVTALFKKAFQSCLQEKIREGQTLKKDITGNLSSLEKSLEKIRTIHQREKQKAETRYKKSLQKEQSLINGERLKALSKNSSRSLKGKGAPVRGNFNGSKGFMGGEGSFDINEEIVRLREHLKNCKKLVRQKGPTGKKLDFYSQEVLRELNSIGSKSQTALITCQVVDSKFSLEKIKEQVQNIE
ncbi:MAG: DUF1732 domain-containing protein [Bdellovibrionales bacterium]|nr:DUF1732 domain-containing protein [Bdellovibrionales bacterium]